VTFRKNGLDAKIAQNTLPLFEGERTTNCRREERTKNQKRGVDKEQEGAARPDFIEEKKDDLTGLTHWGGIEGTRGNPQGSKKEAGAGGDALTRSKSCGHSGRGEKKEA